MTEQAKTEVQAQQDFWRVAGLSAGAGGGEGLVSLPKKKIGRTHSHDNDFRTKMNAGVPKLFRAHSTKYLAGATGIITNPNLDRARRPRDMPLATHQVLSEWFVDRFGVDYRGRSLFCTGDASIAAGYRTDTSTLVSIEPLGEYSLCYAANCKDLFGYYQFNWSAADTQKEKIRADLDLLGFVHLVNDGIEEAATSGHEVMLVAERFRYNVR